MDNGVIRGRCTYADAGRGGTG